MNDKWKTQLEKEKKELIERQEAKTQELAKKQIVLDALATANIPTSMIDSIWPNEFLAHQPEKKYTRLTMSPVDNHRQLFDIMGMFEILPLFKKSVTKNIYGPIEPIFEPRSAWEGEAHTEPLNKNYYYAQSIKDKTWGNEIDRQYTYDRKKGYLVANMTCRQYEKSQYGHITNNTIPMFAMKTKTLFFAIVQGELLKIGIPLNYLPEITKPERIGMGTKNLSKKDGHNTMILAYINALYFIELKTMEIE